MSPTLAQYLPALGLTLAVELPVLVILLGRRCGVGRTLVAGLLASGVTHPLLWFAWPHVISRWRFTLYVTTGEALVAVAEAAIIVVVCFVAGNRDRDAKEPFGIQVVRALLASVVANGASFTAGVLLFW